MPEQLSLLPEEKPEEHPLRRQLREGTRRMAESGIHIGTSSWKYEGWLDLIYERKRYFTRGKFSRAKFNAHCLEEYAETFSTVCVDGGFYQFPSERYVEGLVSQVPDDFQFSFKVTEDITVLHFPPLERLGARAGQANSNFLNAELFESRFLAPCRKFKSNIGMLIFQFSQMPASKHEEFLTRLDNFFRLLPGDWEYGVEIRNPELLCEDYFRVLEENNVGHIYNSWDAMMSIEEQLDQIGNRLDGLHGGSRLLLKPGRNYNSAVKRFSPYMEIKEVYEKARAAAARMIRRFQEKKKRLSVYGNNRLEGCSPITLANVIERVEKQSG
ncbi:MAG: hypothetical protein CMO80_24410 [Verrucomicrobiales bacterium]|nr:hypothetical protein [Verrucomicrobiales bacterium]|tara:strand:- start:6983 stop:7963 length:981 start_codon:yes stop_codon:yes gene_type:complete